MKICIIVAEFNPFHNGHKYIIDEVKKLGFTHIAVIMSGNFVQRGEPALISKAPRAHTAILNGANLVLEIPTVWALSTAQKYASAAVEIAGSLGCADAIAFGSECGNINILKNLACCLTSSEFPELLKKHLNEGITFAKAREMAVNSISESKYPQNYLGFPNNILGVEYIGALNKYRFNIEPITIKRVGFNDIDSFRSASEIREMIKNNDDKFQKYIPKSSFEIISNQILKKNVPICLENAQKAVIYKLRTICKNDVLNLPDISEGLENRILKAAKEAIEINDFLFAVKTKRYTMSRIKRILLCAFLGISKKMQDGAVPYIRVLASDSAGYEILKKAKANALLPIVHSYSEIKKLSDKSKEIFELECKSTDLYNLLSPKIKPCGLEKSFKIITPDKF